MWWTWTWHPWARHRWPGWWPQRWDTEPGEVAVLGQALAAKTDGNPFFVLQSLRQLHGSGELRRLHGRWQVEAAALQRLPGPRRLMEALAQSLATLPVAQRHLAAASGCLGAGSDLALLADVMEQPLDSVASSIQPLVHAGLMFLSDAAVVPRRFWFGHDQFQHAAHGLIAPLNARPCTCGLQPVWHGPGR